MGDDPKRNQVSNFQILKVSLPLKKQSPNLSNTSILTPNLDELSLTLPEEMNPATSVEQAVAFPTGDDRTGNADVLKSPSIILQIYNETQG